MARLHVRTFNKTRRHELPVGRQETRPLIGLYYDRPEVMDDPYGYFGS